MMPSIVGYPGAEGEVLDEHFSGLHPRDCDWSIVRNNPQLVFFFMQSSYVLARPYLLELGDLDVQEKIIFRDTWEREHEFIL